jgi:hypothetical protein
MTYTITTQKKLEALLEALSYKVRYEKGNFQSGYCLVKDRKVAVINKFFATEARINSLLDIISIIEISEAEAEHIAETDEKQGKLLTQIRKREPKTEEKPT